MAISIEQFAALAQLLQGRDGASMQAARLVLVDGLTQVAAAQQTGLTPSGVSKAVSRIRSGLVLAKVASAGV